MTYLVTRVKVWRVAEGEKSFSISWYVEESKSFSYSLALCVHGPLYAACVQGSLRYPSHRWRSQRGLIPERKQRGRENRTALLHSLLGLTSRANIQRFIMHVREKQILLWNTDISENWESLAMNSNKWVEGRGKPPRANYTLCDNLVMDPTKLDMEETWGGRNYSLGHTSYRLSPVSKWEETGAKIRTFCPAFIIHCLWEFRVNRLWFSFQGMCSLFSTNPFGVYT